MQYLLYGIVNFIVRRPAQRNKVQFGFKLGRNFIKALQKQWVERPALAVHNHFHRLFGRIRVLVNALARQSVVNVGNGDHLRRYGNIVPLKPVGISPPVVSLVVVTADIVPQLD